VSIGVWPTICSSLAGNVSLEIIHRQREGIEMLDLSGQLTFGQENLDFQNELAGLIAAGALFFALAKLRKAGGKLAILNMKPSQMEVRVEANLETFIEVFQNEPDAINSFSLNEKSNATTSWSSSNPSWQKKV
jgi:hypothetical protein